MGNWLLPKSKSIAKQRIKNAKYFDHHLSKLKEIRIPPRPKNYKIVRQEINTLGSQVDIMPTIMDIMNMEYNFPMFGKSLVRKFKHKYVKGNIEGGWLLYDERFISMRHKKSSTDVFGNPLFVNEIDQELSHIHI